MRFLASCQAVNYMREGPSPTAACEKVLSLVAEKFPCFQGGLICVAKEAQSCRAGLALPLLVPGPFPLVPAGGRRAARKKWYCSPSDSVKK